MLSTPLICCSIGVATDCSTVCASAPMYVVCTCTSGGAIAGNCEIGRVTMVMAPTMTVSSEITMATIGRLMKNLDTSASNARRLAGDDLDDRPVANFQQALDNHAFAGFQTLGHDPQVPDAVADRHGTDRHLVIAAHDRHLMTPLQLGDRALRNQQGAGRRLYGEPHTSKSARAKQIVGIGKHRSDSDRPGCRVDLPIGKRDRPGMFVDLSITERQLKRDALALLCDALFGRKPAMEVR